MIELNIDGLVGPTHHYAGLSEGNLASTTHAFLTSNPQEAALQGLAKMRLLHQLGLRQALFPPPLRPNLALLSQMGFTGTPAQQIDAAYRTAPQLLSAVYSASSMWAANTATVSSSLDTLDRKVHFTPANLISNFHRHQEAHFSSLLLQRLFENPTHFTHHPPLPSSLITMDEGAANHNRLCVDHAQEGLNIFVYGKTGIKSSVLAPTKFPARQTLEASQAIARAHRLRPEKTIFVQQNPNVIDRGVFHNDVIAVANNSVFLLHEEAFVDQASVLESIRQREDFSSVIVEIKQEQLSVKEAVRTYLFNSQLVTLPSTDGHMALIAPAECEYSQATASLIASFIEDSRNPIETVYYLDLKQSMRNGGGPACLRLRVPLTNAELKAMHQGVLIDDTLLAKLEAWIKKHYRTELTSKDLRDVTLMNESLTALDELSQLLQLGSFYRFQQL